MKKADRRAAFLPNGDINRRHIREVAHRAMALLVVSIRAAIPPPAPAMLWLRRTVIALYNMGQAADFADTLKLLFALARIAAPPTVEPLVSHPATASYFMFACLCAAEEMTEGAEPLAVD